MLFTISCTVTSIPAFSVMKKLEKSRKKTDLSRGNISVVVLAEVSKFACNPIQNVWSPDF
jgi:hypothetical protein